MNGIISNKNNLKYICLLRFLILAFLFFIGPGPSECFAQDGLSGINRSGLMNTKPSVDPLGSGSGYSVLVYDNKSGMSTSEANAMARTQDGSIWIGSYSGLIHYDGKTFERLDSTDGIACVVSLFTDSKDRLWIGTNDSGIALMERDGFRFWGKAEGMRSASVRSIAEDTEGRIYAATTEGLVVINQDMNLVSFDDPRVDEVNMRELRMSNDGIVYGLTKEGDIFTIENGRISFYLSHEDIRVRNIKAILPDPENPGNLYLGTNGSEVYYGNLKENFSVMGFKNIAPLSSMESFEYIDGRLWFCTSKGIGILDGDNFFRPRGIPLNNSVGNMMVDYQGNMWFTSTRQGLMKIVPNQFSNLFERYDLSETVVNTTCLYGPQLFIGTDNGLRVIDPRGLISTLKLETAQTASGRSLKTTNLMEMLEGCRIRSIIEDSKGRLWISTWLSHGLLCYTSGSVTAYTVEDGMLSDRIRAVYECRDGSILVALNGGVNVIRDGRVIASYDEKDGIVNTDILTAAEGKDGELILGSDGGGIYIIDETGTRNIGLEEGLPSEIVMRIKYDPKRDIYWIVMSNGIAWMDSDYRITAVHNFPYSNNFDLYESNKGDMWVLSSNGIYVVPIQELLENGNIEAVHYSLSNGLPCIATANSYSELTDEGDLYIAGSTGVAKVNIEQTYDNEVELKLDVPYIEADGMRVYPDDNGAFTIDSHVRKLTIYGYVYNYSLIDPQVSYRLDGFDEKSITVNRDDLGPVAYTNLSGGTYHFEMRLMDSMGVDEELSVRITKTKAFYEQTWFYFLISLVTLIVLVECVQLYVRMRMRILEKKHREEAEKERIGTELKTAAQIQESMLPNRFPAFPDRKEFDIYATMEPAREVGGDFYDFFLIDEDHLGIVIADVSGKGIPAALVMMITKTILQNCAMRGISAGEILAKTNESICSNNEMEMFITAWVGILHISTGVLTAANAGHEYPAVYYEKEGSFSLLKDKHGLVLGGIEGTRYKEYELMLKPGDKLFVYTDGVPEATSADDELFGTERMIDALNSHPREKPEEILSNVRKAVGGFVGSAEQFDDMTMLCLQYKGPGQTHVYEMETEASLETMRAVLAFVETHLVEAECPLDIRTQIIVAVEELYVNIANYAYGNGTGKAKIRMEMRADPPVAVITLIDSGVPFDPLKRKDPDVKLPLEKRTIGGLGIYMVKKSMDAVTYEYRDGQNHLTIKKGFTPGQGSDVAVLEP